MANYDSAAGIQDVIDSSLAAGGLSAATAAAITELLQQLGDQAPAATVVTDQSITSAADVPADAQIIIMDSNTSANVTFGADSDVKAMVVGGAGNSEVVFQTSDDVTVQLGGGENDSVATGAGADNITFAGGSATIDTGAGNDVVTLQGEGTANISGGAGDMNVVLESDSVSATIDAGDGFDTVSLGGSIASRIFTFIGNAFHMAARAVGRAAGDADDAGITMENVNVVSFTDDAGKPQEITVLADSAEDAVFTSLYQVVLGRQAIDSGADSAQMLNGINYWTTQFDAAHPDSSMSHAVETFMACDEIVNKYANMSAEQTVQQFFDNLGAVNGTTIAEINGQTVDSYAQLINSGEMTVAEVAQQIVTGTQSVQILGQNGAAYFVAPEDIFNAE